MATFRPCKSSLRNGRTENGRIENGRIENGRIVHATETLIVNFKNKYYSKNAFDFERQH
jgi:hypothetical protein